LLAVPNWRVQSSSPAASYFRTNASLLPALDCPGKVPSVRPTTSTLPSLATLTDRASSVLALPNWRVQSSVPAASYFRTNAS
jgi:hypothetical protein